MNSFVKYILKIAKWAGYVEPTPITLWQSKVIEFATKQPVLGIPMVVGDSITAGWATTKLLNRCNNYGIAGDVTSGVLDRTPQIIVAEPSRVILNIGTNDIGFGVPQFATLANYRYILKALSAHIRSDNIIVCALRPINNKMPMAQGRDNNTIKEYNKMLATLSKECGCIFEPNTYTCNLIKLPNGEEYLSPVSSTDGLHLSVRGYRQEFDVLQKYL